MPLCSAGPDRASRRTTARVRTRPSRGSPWSDRRELAPSSHRPRSSTAVDGRVHCFPDRVVQALGLRLFGRPDAPVENLVGHPSGVVRTDREQAPRAAGCAREPDRSANCGSASDETKAAVYLAGSGKSAVQSARGRGRAATARWPELERQFFFDDAGRRTNSTPQTQGRHSPQVALSRCHGEEPSAIQKCPGTSNQAAGW
jgi:hypothetical protein